jgi:hypothetical protein
MDVFEKSKNNEDGAEVGSNYMRRRRRGRRTIHQKLTMIVAMKAEFWGLKVKHHQNPD